MKFVILLVVQILIVHVVYSSVTQLKNSENAEHPGKCYWGGKDSPTILEPGEIVTLKGECTRATCHDDLGMDLATCGIVFGPKEYYIPGNLSLPYPDCCPTYDFSKQ